MNSRARNFTTGKIAGRIAHSEAGVEHDIAEMVRGDRQEEGEGRGEKVAYLAKALRPRPPAHPAFARDGSGAG